MLDGSPLVVSSIGRYCEECAEGEYEGEEEDSRERRDHELAVGEPGENRYRIQRGRDGEIDEADVDGSFASTEDSKVREYQCNESLVLPEGERVHLEHGLSARVAWALDGGFSDASERSHPLACLLGSKRDGEPSYQDEEALG